MSVTTGVSRRAPAMAAALAAALVAALLLAPPPAAGQDGPLIDPLPDPVMSNLVVTVEEFVQLPQTAPSPAPTDQRIAGTRARVNYVGEVPDGSGRLYVPDLNGPMYLIEDGEPHLYLDINDYFRPWFWNHAGLGSGFGFIAFHPEFSDNGKFYTVHVEGRLLFQRPAPTLPHWPQITRHGVIIEWTADDPTANSFSGTFREVMRLGYRTNIHGLQQIGFNPLAEPGHEDYGLLYVASGDGGNAHFTNLPQDTTRAEGNLLRIDPLGDNGPNGQYGIPDSNPFVGQPGYLGEIYAYGLRNPHRFSWDPVTKRMYLGQIGDWHIEAIYEVRKGDNFGWAEREGPFLLGPDRWPYPLPENDHEFGYVYPVAAYDHGRQPGQTGDLGFAVVGGFVYRGSKVPVLNGLYIFTDIVNGEMYYTRAGQMHQEREEMAPIFEFRLRDAATGQIVDMMDLAGQERVDTRLGIDASGELFISAKANGKIWRVVDAHRVPPTPPGN